MNLLIISSCAREIAERVSYLRNCDYQQMPQHRTTLRLFADITLKAINAVIAGMLKDGKSLHECNASERRLVARLKVLRSDIHHQLQSVCCDIDED
ncbi:TPA: hypothetical protein ACGPGP_002670 [Escherichia coli]|uniref:hypothetical protein n=1 Tax=Escherichia coli TaxID=562 RepID=UPI0019573B4C|nr:hypothetical protein [Escherichia coli]MCS1594834.1 hypothetical protein [Escherichia coli]QRU88599.1 hypothetical protein I6K14_06310 [Escherichia coli]HAL7340544.1 hypothetical protein [Escherichia coli]HAL7387798.1 hypothetical protein [Escherichia coli]HBI7553319.1 hypothetical protein [Escherichia coli]